MRALQLLIPMVATLLAGCGGGGGSTTSSGGGGVGGGGGSTGSAVAIYILVGGDSSATKPPGPDIFLDNLAIASNRLRPGEIYVMPKSALAASTNFTIAVNATTATETFAKSWSFVTGTTANPSTFTSTVVDELNAFRTQSGAVTVGYSNPYGTAAQRHSGYQCETSAISHNEADSSAHFFINTDFWRRISIALGKPANAADPHQDPAPWGPGVTTVYEDIATTAGVAAVDQLWNTVYHRIPMMRTEVGFIGNGDRSAAFTDSLNSPQVIAATGTGFQTIEFAGNGAMQTLSFWPADGQTGIPISFSTDSESPDPISSGNGNGTSDANVVGPPLTVLFPTSQDFTTVTVTLTQN